MYKISTTIPSNEIRDFEFFLSEYGFDDFDILVNHTTMYLILSFAHSEDAVLFRLREFDVFYVLNHPFYFEPDTDFEIELEKIYGSYSDADDCYMRQ